MNNFIDWVRSLKDNINNFLSLMNKNDFSYFKYSLSGDLFTEKNNWGLGNLVFATKILYITGLIDDLTKEQKTNLKNSILKFSGNDGMIYDPIITSLSIKDKIKKKLGLVDKTFLENIQEIRRAETRQSFAALHLLKSKPKIPFKKIPYNKDGIIEYLKKLDWSNPWSAGSHFSHLLFFLKMNSEFFSEYSEDESQELIKFAFDWIMEIQSEQDGSWYLGKDVPLNIKINGAMKVLTGLHAAGIYDFPNSKKLIDTALLGINDEEACSNFNIAYVLYCCKIIEPSYRNAEIEKFLLERIDLYKKFYHENIGAFSFYKRKANDIYYGKKITKGKNEPDIHGTILFIWGISIINQVIDLGIDFKIPLN